MISCYSTGTRTALSLRSRLGPGGPLPARPPASLTDYRCVVPGDVSYPPTYFVADGAGATTSVPTIAAATTVSQTLVLRVPIPCERVICAIPPLRSAGTSYRRLAT
jgi:hypothetical protein